MRPSGLKVWSTGSLLSKPLAAQESPIWSLSTRDWGVDYLLDALRMTFLCWASLCVHQPLSMRLSWGDGTPFASSDVVLIDRLGLGTTRPGSDISLHQDTDVPPWALSWGDERNVLCGWRHRVNPRRAEATGLGLLKSTTEVKTRPGKTCLAPGTARQTDKMKLWGLQK